MKRVSCGLSDLEGVAKSLNEYAESLGGKASAVANELAEIASAEAVATCGVGTGELSSSIRAEGTAGGARVVADGDGAAFHEFGTGIGRGPGNRFSQAAAASVGWERDAKGRGEGGWPFRSDLDGEWHTTHGQRGTGFMGAGAEEARASLTVVARKEFGG